MLQAIRLFAVALPCAFLATAASSQIPILQPSAKKDFDPAAELSAVASDLSFLDLAGVYYDFAPNPTIHPETLREFRKSIDKMHQTGESLATRDLATLTKHQDPKLRTLAIIELVRRGEPKYLPTIAALMKDEAQTFPQLVGMHVALAMKLLRTPETKPLTVAEVATHALENYLRPLKLHPPKDWDAYWKARKDRQHCLSWYHAQLTRITGTSSPAWTRWEEAVWSRCRGLLSSLSQEDRDWTMLATLPLVSHSRPLTTSDRRLAMNLRIYHEDELRFAALRRGRKALLGIIEGKAPTDDPDWPFYLSPVGVYILNNAEHVLEPQDANRILALIGKTKDLHPGILSIAAARLRPDLASKILKDSIKANQMIVLAGWSNPDPVVELWRLCELDEIQFILDWFYREGQVQRGSAPQRCRILDFACNRFSPQDRTLLQRIVDDERFDTLDVLTVRKFVLGINRVTPEPLVTTRELYGTSHPYGLLHFHAQLERGMKEHMGQTEALLKKVAGWRAKIRNAKW